MVEVRLDNGAYYKVRLFYNLYIDIFLHTIVNSCNICIYPEFLSSKEPIKTAVKIKTM